MFIARVDPLYLEYPHERLPDNTPIPQTAGRQDALLIREERFPHLSSGRRAVPPVTPASPKPAQSVRATTVERSWERVTVARSTEQATLRLNHTPVVPNDGRGYEDPLFIFACALRWKTRAEIDAGWELVRAARSSNESTRAVALALLADAHRQLSLNEARTTPNKGMDLRVLRNTIISSPAPLSLPRNRYARLEASMNTPYGIEIVDDCTTCKLRRDGCFCNLSPQVLSRFNTIGHPSIFPGGALLFVEGQVPRGIYVLCGGKVKLSTTSRDGKVLILRIAGPGEVLGLSAVVSGTSCELTAQTAMPCQVKFVERDALLRFLAENGEAGLRSAQALSREFQSAYQDIHDLVLARSSAGKLARLLLSWTPLEDSTAMEFKIRSGLTHEEMAQMIGSSRETVTRLLSELKKKQLIRLEGSTLVIRNRIALEAIAS
jgi:CRP/FNR family transcriptional regulator, cyclic AMP receptor protein